MKKVYDELVNKTLIPGWVDGWFDVWLCGSKSQLKDCLQTIKNLRFKHFFYRNIFRMENFLDRIIPTKEIVDGYFADPNYFLKIVLVFFLFSKTLLLVQAF